MATEHFLDAELECKCGCGLLPSREDQDYLEAFRVLYGKPMILNSAMRCPEYNNQVSRSGLDGPHTIFAIDVKVSYTDADDLIELAYSRSPYGTRWWTGIGIRQHGDPSRRFVHLDKVDTDRHPRPITWTYNVYV